MKMLILLAALAATTSAYSAPKTPAQPQAPVTPVPPALSAEAQESCNKHVQAIDRAEREIAMQVGQGIGDDSAPRHTNRMLEQVASQQREEMHIQLMIAERCPAIPSPEGGARYVTAALECRVARGSDVEQKCKMSQWTPAPATP